jgi:hypothetical protein
VSSLDSRSINSLIYPAPSLARKRGVSATVDNWRYLDPTSSDTILSLPRLQDVITDPQELLYEGTDYVVEVFRDPNSTSDAFSVMRFQEPPLEPLWAEYVGYDEKHIRNNFGINVGLEDVSSDIYKARVRGLYYAYFQGPTLNAIRTGVHILIGLPIADVAGEVEGINPAYSGTLGLITVAGRDYLYPLAVGTDLQVGDDVDLFEPLSRGVEITDYRKDPEWFVSTDLHELQKYHHFRVSLNLDAFQLESLDLAGQFVDQIKPTWKQARYLVFKELSDNVDITDALTLVVALNLFDTICDQFVVAYDDNIYEGEEEDWKYSQGIADWDETSAAMRATSTTLVGTAVLTNSATGAVGTGTSWVADIVPPNAYVAVGRYSDSVTGETTAGSLFFFDNTDGVFDNIEPNDHIVIAGEGTFEVNEIVRNVFSSGTGKFLDATTFEDLSATFQADGLQPGDVLVPVGGLNDGLEFEVSSVPSETQIIIAGAATPAEIDTGTGGFVGVTVFESPGATWQTLGVQPGDYLILSGGGANSGQEFEVGLVVDEDQLVIVGAAILSAGETYSIERREDYTVDRENQLTLDAPLGFTNTNVSWEVTGKLKIWSEVASVTDNSNLDFSTPFVGQTGVYVLALLDNDYKQAFYDQFEEFCPEEELEFVATLSQGYQAQLLQGTAYRSFGGARFTTAAGNFAADLGGLGPKSDTYVLMLNGCWIQIDTIIFSNSMSVFGSVPLGAHPSALADAAPLHAVQSVLSGTLNFTNGSSNVPTSVDLTTEVSANDYIQVVPSPDLTDSTSAPVVQVQSITATDITLTALYSGQTVVGTKAINRGASSIFPLAQDLPDSKTTTTPLNFTDWPPAAGATISSVVAEP